MFPLASFVYPVFVNLDLAKAAGVDKHADEPHRVRRSRQEDDRRRQEPVSAGCCRCRCETPNGIQNDVMSWVWASGAIDAEGRQAGPRRTRPSSARSNTSSRCNDAGVISPGIFAKKEQDKVEEFVNGRVGMMVDSLAHINLIRERNPDLNFGISAIPAVDGYTGKRGLPYASWGIGISEGSEHKEEAWKLVEYLMSPEVNAKLVSIANAFPGNVNAKPDFVASPIRCSTKAFKIFQEGYLANEFVGLPVAEELMRQMDIEVQKMFDGQQTAQEAAAATQTAVGSRVRQVGGARSVRQRARRARRHDAAPGALLTTRMKGASHGQRRSTNAIGPRSRRPQRRA